MKEKILSFVTASLITVIVMFSLAVLGTRSFLSDSEDEKGNFALPKIELNAVNDVTDIFGKLLSFNKELFPDFLVDYVSYNAEKTVDVAKTAINMCAYAVKESVNAP